MRQSLLVLLSVFLAAPVLAAEPEFSADMKMTAGDQNIESKVYYSKKKARFDMPMAVSITRMDEGATYVLLPKEKTYMRQPLDAETTAKIGAVGGGETERVLLRKEKINGIDTEKFKVTYSGKQGEMSVYQWLDKDQFPVRVEALDKSWSVEYSNLVPGPQPDSLFELPADYKAFQVPSLGDLQGMLGRGGASQGGSIPPPPGGGSLESVDMESLKKMAEQLKAQYAASEE
jgi:hypothetical protein